MKQNEKSDKWIQGTDGEQGAVRHPGSLKAAARRHGLTTKQEAQKESTSPDPKIRARGNLGKRFLGTAKHGNIRKAHSKTKGRKHTAKKV